LLLPIAACQPAEALGPSPAGLEQSRVSVTTAGGKKRRFVVEIADTPEQQSYGLMNRQSLEPNRGMIFPYDPPQPVSFWMKNTYIPLDIIFIAPGGRVSRIEENTVPLSLEPVVSTEPVEAVLEIAGGRSAELGIAAGDKVDWRE
jgi:uncharacterized membrane protein (UPF0127 family)